MTLHPTQMMEPLKILDFDFSSSGVTGSIAGSVGKKQNSKRKPGIQEDGGLVALSSNIQIYLLIDAHYHRDITEIMLQILEKTINEGDWDDVNKTNEASILGHCLDYSNTIITELRSKNSTGEASYCLLIYLPDRTEMFYFTVGDLMIFVNNPRRIWGTAYQISTRHFYEWINSQHLMSYHFGRVFIQRETKIIVTTDGLIDLPRIPGDRIDQLFAFEKFEAKEYVKYALEAVPEQEDDNIAVICLKF